MYGERRREFGGIWGEFVDVGVWLWANDVGVVAGVVGVSLTFAGERMEGDGLVGDVVHEKREGQGRGRSKGEGI